MTKTVKFEFNGGEYVQRISARGENLPWRYECQADWVTITAGTSELKISVVPTYDYHNRQTDIDIFDRYNNRLTLTVLQYGYYDLKVECPRQLVMYSSYYDTSDYFNVYLTIYGGERQEPSCTALKPYISKVWDNSSLYNDFVIKVPKDLDGDYVIEHMDARQYRKYCKQNGIPYDNSKLRKNITIKQFSENDVIGEMVISVDGKTYRSSDSDEIKVEIGTSVSKEINILSTKFVKIKSNTEYEIVDNRNVYVTNMACWVDYHNKPGTILLKGNDDNMLSDRECCCKIVNSDNPHQFINITLIQKCGN